MNIEVVKELINQNKSTTEIAKVFNTSQTSVVRYLKKHKLSTNFKFAIKTSTHKECTECNKLKLHEDFYKRDGNNLQSMCKECTLIHTIKRRQIVKQKAIEYKGGKCTICNYNTYNGALEFHHLDPNEKDFNIAEITTTIFNEKIKTELDKCILLCSNCHREVHGGLIPLN